MSDTIIKVEGIGKKYRVRHQRPERYSTLRDAIADKARNVFRSRPVDIEKQPAIEDFWALKDVSFEVKRGEVVGIIGRNGAGKSTLLKILSRITEPTTGRVEIDGRVASLLEVGTGFHPELTGRENIYLNGAIMGMSRAEIKRRFDEIVAFAEVEKFLDTPVKRYSSGMYVRLAFAVAAHLEPEILIVDEVLAVGDVEFQKKCLGKMKNVAASEGRTVLFVSHSMSAIQTLCKRAVYLNRGQVAGCGEASEQISRYTHAAFDNQPQRYGRPRRVSESLVIETIKFSPNPVHSGRPLEFSVVMLAGVPTELKDLCLLISSGLGNRVAIVDLRSANIDYSFGSDRRLKINGSIKRLNLVEGDYSIGVYINCSELNRDIYDLSTLSVLKMNYNSDFLPYPAYDRGYVELEYDFVRE
jgi:lipopolysaccharide transport system ATP-binding protein